MTVGNIPVGDQQLIDGRYVNGIAQGKNWVFQNGITATGSSTQAGAFQLADRVAIVEVDTAAANSGVALPPAQAGSSIMLYNNGASTLTVYPSIANNPATGAQDTINNTTSVTQTTKTSKIYYCGKNGVWAAQ